jgi:hypothetical protein
LGGSREGVDGALVDVTDDGATDHPGALSAVHALACSRRSPCGAASPRSPARARPLARMSTRENNSAHALAHLFAAASLLQRPGARDVERVPQERKARRAEGGLDAALAVVQLPPPLPHLLLGVLREIKEPHDAPRREGRVGHDERGLLRRSRSRATTGATSSTRSLTCATRTRCSR